MAVTVEGPSLDSMGRADSRDWQAFSPVYREGPDGGVITTRVKPVRVVAGVFKAQFEPGPLVLVNPDGTRWTVTVPDDETASLWEIISAAIAFPPDTAQEALAAAVTTFLDENPVVTMQVDGITDAGPAGKLVVQAETADDVLDAVEASESGVTVLKGTPTQGLAALGGVGKGDLNVGVRDYGATGDGATNDRTTVATADAAAVAAGVPLRFKKGTYRFASTITIASYVIMDPGAVLKPDSGVTVTMTGGMDAPLRKVFDVSAGGKVRVKNPVVYFDWWGAVGDGVTDDAAAIRMVFNDNVTAFGGGTIDIPFGKVYASTLPIDMKSNTRVVGSGGLKCLAFHSAGMFVQYKNAVKNVTWDGPTVDINGIENMNGHAVGDVPNTTDFVDTIWIRGKIIGARIDKALEAFNTYLGNVPVLYGGGGKGLTVQFRARNVYANVITEDCDIACSVEAAVSDDRWLENIVLDVHAKDSHRTALFIGGSRDTISSANSASYMHSKFPGVKVRLRAQGGQDGLMYNPVSGLVDGVNWSNAGVVTLNYASGVDIEVYAATVNRCTLVRGMAAGSAIRITKALMDVLQDVWDTRPLDTLTPAGSIMSDNTFDAKVHSATHQGVLVRPHRSSGSPAMQRSTIDVDAWCQNGVGAITQDDAGVTDSFGASVAYRFRDMRSSPIKEIVGMSSVDAKPQWALAPLGGRVSVQREQALVSVPGRTVVATAAGVTTLTALSTPVWVFTGSTTQTMVLPTTSVLTGQCYTVVNQSSGSVAVQSSNGNSILSVLPGRFVTLMAAIDTPVAAADWYLAQATVTSGSGTAMTGTVNMRDTNGNAFADNFTALSSSTTTSGGTLTLDVNSRQTQVLTGSSNHTVVLPTSSILAGQQFTIINSSSGTVTVNSSGGGLVASLAAGESKLMYALQATPTTAAHWRVI